jgi:P-aminobenzoate N-oxygenase AurF
VAATDVRINRLNDVSARQLREPEDEFDWSTLGRGRLLGDDLLSVAGLDLDLTEAQRVQLSREEVASMLASGIRFEAVLDAAFSLQLAFAQALDDPRHVYMLHEVGEETRHQRAFLRLREQIAPTAQNPFDKGNVRAVVNFMIRILVRSPAMFCVMLLAGEEIPDLLQKLATEHPDTDPLLRAVNKYHRAEEARHLAFARMILPEHWAAAGPLERARVRYLAPRQITMLFSAMVHPGVYRAIGLPGFATWKAVNRAPRRLALRYTATRPILETLVDAGVLRRGRIPRGWRDLCGVDRDGAPVTAPFNP